MSASSSDEVADRVLHVVVTGGLTGVGRVVGVLRLRGTAPRSLTARATTEGDTWELEHALRAGREEVALLARQLRRLPSVLTVVPVAVRPGLSSSRALP